MIKKLTRVRNSYCLWLDQRLLAALGFDARDASKKMVMLEVDFKRRLLVVTKVKE